MEHDPNQPLALIKKVAPTTTTSSFLPHPSTIVSSLGTSSPSPVLRFSPGLVHAPPISGVPPFFSIANVPGSSGPAVIVTTRTPIFIRSPSSVSPRGQGNNIMAHTQMTPSVMAGRISAAVRPSSIRNPGPRALISPVRIPPQVISPVLHVRPPHYVGPRMSSPPLLQPIRLPPPPPRSPTLKVTGPPPVAHMAHQPNLSYIRPAMKSPVNFSIHANRPKQLSGSVIRSPTSTQQVRPIVFRAPVYRSTRPSNTLLTIPGSPSPRLQAALKSPQQQSVSHHHMSFSQANHQVLRIQQAHPSAKQFIQTTQPSPIRLQTQPRQVILNPRGLPLGILPAGFKGIHNLKGHFIPTTSVAGKQKVLVAVNPQALKHSSAVRIQAKPRSSNPSIIPQRHDQPMVITTQSGTPQQMVVSQSQVLVPVGAVQTPPRLSPAYLGKRRGRKPGSKNKIKGLKVKLKPGIYRPIAAKKTVPTTVQPISVPEKLIAVTSDMPSTSQASSSQQEDSGEQTRFPTEETKRMEVQEEAQPNPVKEIPKAVVKPQILTHVIDGFIIEESKDPFPMPESNSLLPVAAGAGVEILPGMRGIKRKSTEHISAYDNKLRCEFCGKEDFPRKFKRSKRFCSMACAKRYNVGCTKRLGLFSPKEAAQQQRIKHKLKAQGPKAQPLKGTRGRYGRLKFNVTQPWHPKTKLILQALPSENTGSTPSTSSTSGTDESHSSTSSNAPTLSPIINEPDSTPFADELDVLPPGLPRDPSQWSVDDVKEFIRSVPGCLDFAEEFHSQEIDGQALMLLKEDHLMTAMSMKLGPALKIISKINMLREMLV